MTAEGCATSSGHGIPIPPTRGSAPSTRSCSATATDRSRWSTRPIGRGCSAGTSGCASSRPPASWRAASSSRPPERPDIARALRRPSTSGLIGPTGSELGAILITCWKDSRPARWLQAANCVRYSRPPTRSWRRRHGPRPGRARRPQLRRRTGGGRRRPRCRAAGAPRAPRFVRLGRRRSGARCLPSACA